ncbi:hypothetical protein HY480_01725 [Candidatus Uhrbacteria bacterium]|nr:hypothetical protein [Candidatus Uhrbacteria bacterium]
MPEFKRSIRIDADGTATYERRVVIPGADGMPATERTIEQKRTDAAVLLPSSGTLTVLPANCRIHHTHERRTVIVTEDAPAVRTVQWDTTGEYYDDLRNNLRAGDAHRRFGETRAAFANRLVQQQTFRLAFPYVVKCFQFVDGRFSTMSLWYQCSPITDARTELLVSNLPNQQPENHEVCLPHDVRDLGKPGGEALAIAATIQEIEREFWGSWWNQDLLDDSFVDARRMPEVASPWEWERTSRVDPLFVLRMPWRSAECTVGQEVQRLLMGRSDVHDDRDAAGIFDICARRMQAADPWDAAPRPTEMRVRVSPAQTIALNDAQTLAHGDILTLPALVWDAVPDGGEYAVEWFSIAEGNGDRLVKLEGIEQPLRLVIGTVLVRGIHHRARSVPPEQVVTVAGVTLGPKALCRFVGRQWPEDEGAWQVMQNARVDTSGAIAIAVGDEDEYPIWRIIGEHGALYPGVEVRPAEAVDAAGRLMIETFQFRDGTTIAWGDVVCDSGGHGSTIQCFLPIAHGDVGHRFLATDMGEYVFEDAHGGLERTLCILPKEPIMRARSGRVRIRVGGQTSCRCVGIRTVQRITPRFADGTRYVDLSGGIRHLFGGRSVPHCTLTAVPRAPRATVPDASLTNGTAPTPENGVRCINPGALVGTDRQGWTIHVGDRVRTSECSSDSDARQFVARHQDHIYTVVHLGEHWSGNWCYLDAGLDLQQRVRDENVVGFHAIPHGLRTDPTWWARLVWAQVSVCTRVTDDARRS